MRLMPSESTRKFALPKLRIARIRPPAVVSILGDSSASADFSPCASTSAVMLSVLANRFG